MPSYQIRQSSTAYPLVFLMVDSTDHITGKVGLSPTVTLSKAGGAFASPAGAVTEISAGWYKVAGNATDSGTLGPLLLHATGTGADPTDSLYEVVAHDVQDTVRLGLTALPAVASGSAGAIVTSGTGTAQLSVSSGLVTLAGVTHTGAVIPVVTTVTNQIAATAIADAFLARSTATVEATMPEFCIGSLVHAALKWAISGSTWTVYESDGTTALLTRTIVVTGGQVTGVS